MPASLSQHFENRIPEVTITPASSTINTDSGTKNATKIPHPKATTETPIHLDLIPIVFSQQSFSVLILCRKTKKVSPSLSFSSFIH